MPFLPILYPSYFPHPFTADSEGLLAIGGDLSLERLILAYRFGIYPWYSEGQPILWFSPKSRFVINVGHLHIPKSMRKYLNNSIFHITLDQHFDYIIHQCQQTPRPGQSGTWITDDMKAAYQVMHQAGLAHSVEVWQENEIVGGLYGVGIGKIFSGESMFSEVSDASKFAVIILDQILSILNFQIIDCQQYSRHMELLGGYPMDQKTYFDAIKRNLFNPMRRSKWSNEWIPNLYSKKSNQMKTS